MSGNRIASILEEVLGLFGILPLSASVFHKVNPFLRCAQRGEIHCRRWIDGTGRHCTDAMHRRRIFHLTPECELYAMLLKATPFRRSVLPILRAGELFRVVLSMNSSEFCHGTESPSELTQDQVWLRLNSVFFVTVPSCEDPVVVS